MTTIFDVCSRFNCKYLTVETVGKNNRVFTSYCNRCKLNLSLTLSLEMFEDIYTTADDNKKGTFWRQTLGKCVHLDYILKLNRLRKV